VSLQLAVRFVHLVAVATWVGGMLFIALVLVPVTRRLDDAALRTRLIQDTGRRFRRVGWIALGLIVATGLGNLVLRPELLGAPRFHAKAGLVVLALILAALHDFVLGPRAGRPGADPAAPRRASWVARVNVLIALAIVALGLALRG
jgi:putative copper export protein